MVKIGKIDQLSRRVTGLFCTAPSFKILFSFFTFADFCCVKSIGKRSTCALFRSCQLFKREGVLERTRCHNRFQWSLNQLGSSKGECLWGNVAKRQFWRAFQFALFVYNQHTEHTFLFKRILIRTAVRNLRLLYFARVKTSLLTSDVHDQKTFYLPRSTMDCLCKV